jgi:TRAP transporter TAXI family solute receptor
MKKLYFILAVAWATFIAVLPTPAAAQATLKVATGSPKGTYAAMFREIYQVCGNEVGMVEVASTGSQENINQLVGNQVNAAFVQSDVLYLRARTEELGNVKTLMALHPEQVHFVARADAKVGGKMGFGGEALTSVVQLAGLKVGAAGGSGVTSQVIRLQTEIPYSTVLFDKDDEVEAALKAGKIDAAIFVGGAPLGRVAALGVDFRLLSIPAAAVEKLKGVYKAARLNYPKMGAAGVTTVQTDALFVTREYKTEKMTTSLARFRACALAKVDELKETTGTHPAWQAVDTANRGKWPWYELPAAAVAKK